MYLDPPENAVVVCVDESSQIQALDRTAPLLPMRFDEAERRTHGYERHGTTTLFAALEFASGKITADACYDRHRNTEFLAFLKQVAKAHPRVQLHAVADNYATHNHPNVKALLAKYPRSTMHFTPTSASWMNIGRGPLRHHHPPSIRRATFTSVADLTGAIRAFIDGYNQRCEPFRWTKTSDEILAKPTVERTQTRGTRASSVVIFVCPRIIRLAYFRRITIAEGRLAHTKEELMPEIDLTPDNFDWAEDVEEAIERGELPATGHDIPKGEKDLTVENVEEGIAGKAAKAA